MFYYIERVLILSLGIIFVIQQLTGWAWLSTLLSLFVLANLFVHLPRIRGTVQVLSITFLVIGIAIMFYQQASIQEWEEAATLNTTLITLFVFAPLFGIPVRSPVYVSALKQFYQKSIKGGVSFFVASQLLTNILAVFLNVGSISIVHHLVSIHKSSRSWQIVTTALTRGFASAILWSPYFAAMALLSSALDIKWVELLPYLLGFCVIYIFISLVMDLPLLRIEVEVGDRLDNSERVVFVEGSTIKRLYSLVGYLVFAMVLILSLERIVKMPMVLIVSLTAVVYPLVWCISTRSWFLYKQGIKDHITRNLPSLKKEITLFLTAGFFSGAMAQTNLGMWIPDLLSVFPVPIALGFTLTSLLLIVLTSSIGAHPIILISILVTTVNPSSVEITPEYFAILLLGSWSISNIISPASAVNNLLANFVGKDVFQIARLNYKFSAVLLMVLPIYLYIIVL
ncbi:hypothetical protein [Radiobacillus sp. PE A8.2]|uniref:hypothetical protein n=1 Tax=Radiobacillus sp. PE A8.2 TaxID=3380349 RepID=UPI00388F3F8E